MTKDIVENGIMSRKASKASKLTPVAGETGMTVAQAAVLPNDIGLFMSNEAITIHAQALRKFASDAIIIADGLDAMVGESSAPKVDEKKAAVEAKVTAEKAADARIAAEEEATGESFSDRMKRLTASAQASAFKAADDGGSENEADGDAEATSGWECPEHGDLNLTTLTPRKGEPYLMCGIGDCEQFEQ
jgi:hypothetical protein